LFGIISKEGWLMGKKTYWPYLAIAPSVILLLSTLGFPIIQVLLTSVSKTSSSGEITAFNGLRNFRRLFSDPELPSVGLHTLIWTAGILIPATLISILISVLLDMKLPARVVIRIVVFAPWAISFVFLSIIWRYTFDQTFGPMNALLTYLIGHAVQIPWLAVPNLAMLSVIWVGITLTVPFTSLVLLAGLQSIPPEVVEAGKCDGAGGLKLFVMIKFPFLQPVLAVATLVNLLAIFNSFPIIWTMTAGGPANATDTFPTFLYRIAFTDYDFGKAAALSVVGLFILSILSIFYVRKSGAKDVF
jgi:ABC-type sugar transport system permease subunit